MKERISQEAVMRDINSIVSDNTDALLRMDKPNAVTARVYGWLYDAACDNRFPPCWRDGVPDERVLSVIAFAAGFIARTNISWDISRHLIDRIVLAEDHAGMLTVSLIAPVPTFVQRAISKAWEEIGCESKENVSFAVLTEEEVADHESLFWREITLDDPEPEIDGANRLGWLNR